MVIGLISILLAGFLNGESENILMYQHNKKWKPEPMFKWKWYRGNYWKYDNVFVQWLMRYPLSFLKDGFHFLKSLSLVLLTVGVVLLQLDLFYSVLFAYVLFGIGFNFGYHK